MAATMETIHALRWPNESAEYRAARDRLLEAEMDLRRRTEAVAELRRALPPGGPVAEDYVFDEGPTDPTADGPSRQVRLSELFTEGRDSLVIYGFMYPPDGNPCPMCTAFLDGLSGNAAQITETVNLAVVGKAPVPMLREWAALRGWRFPHLLSSGGNTFNRDYHAESESFGQVPMFNVFHRGADGIRHAWASEMFFAPSEPDQHPRHADMMWPLWNILDLTPGGRGDGIPLASYQETLKALGRA